MAIEAIERAGFQAGSLIRDHPPRWHHRNKQRVFEIASSSGFPFEGQVTYARWPAQPPPESVEARRQFTVYRGIFEYPVPEPSTVCWHLNFADPCLFVAYGSPLLAQDELQVAEHPVLGSLRDALASEGREPCTVDGRGRPTPVTVTGVQRRCAIDTTPDPAAGRPGGLYGNAFARARVEQVASATKALSPPTVSNILAMSAPGGGLGKYRPDEVEYILSAAYTGFSAARQESKLLVPASRRTIVHSGFWGCGAFGGNRILMTILQSLAADLAEVDIAFWIFDRQGVEVAAEGRREYERLRDDTPSVPRLLDRLVQHGFRWGVSDGN